MIPFRDLLPQNLFFRKLGEIIYHCPKTIVTMIFFICILSFTGLHKLKFEDNFRDGFFLKDSKSVEEHRIFSEFLRPIKMPYMMALIGECTQPGCSMLEDENFEIFENETLKALNQLHTMKQFNRTYHYSLQHLVTFSSEYHFFWLKNRQNLNVNIYLLGDHLVDYEIGQASFSTLHYFSAGTIAMILTVFFIIRHYKQSETVNIILTVTIICCPLFAGIITFCIFSFMGIAINSTMMITPFLVLGVGVDDAFLIMRSWFYSTSAGLDRINHVFSTIGPSITLSSTT
ncbi:unnamed protein product, partial [Thelazia callipaeda]|uniref:SSD domain-containing protein n=1 Tax=Thelazia callipaeda TaxID=103827 RepID=A0A0N5D3W4_THECL